MNEIILLRGAPGVGKTTILDHVRPHLRGGAAIEVDAIWSMLGAVAWTDGGQFLVALVQSLELASGFLASGVRPPILIASPFSNAAITAIPPAFRGRFGAVALVAENDELRRRLADRPSWAFHDASAALALNDELRALPGPDKINTTGRAVSDVAAELLERTMLQRQGVDTIRADPVGSRGPRRG